MSAQAQWKSPLLICYQGRAKKDNLLVFKIKTCLKILEWALEKSMKSTCYEQSIDRIIPKTVGGIVWLYVRNSKNVFSRKCSWNIMNHLLEQDTGLC